MYFRSLSILEVFSRLYEYFLSIQTIQINNTLLIFAYFSNDIFCIINTHHFGTYNFKKHTVYFILYGNKLLIPTRNDC